MKKLAIYVLMAIMPFCVAQKAEAPMFYLFPPMPKHTAQTKPAEDTSKPKEELVSRGGTEEREPQPQTFLVTSYTAGVESTGKIPGQRGYGITASGESVHEGGCACSPDFPFGTVFRVTGVGSFICNDRGGAITGRHIDIYIASYQKAIEFGKQYLPVTVVLPN